MATCEDTLDQLLADLEREVAEEAVARYKRLQRLRAIRERETHGG